MNKKIHLPGSHYYDYEVELISSSSERSWEYGVDGSVIFYFIIGVFSKIGGTIFFDFFVDFFLVYFFLEFDDATFFGFCVG